jgi:SAM-dependent methyltransferase
VTQPDVFDGQRHIWTIGDYPAVAERLLPASVAMLEALGPLAGKRVLDVATGTGNAAIVAARAGAEAVGIDLTPNQLNLARARAEAEGVAVDLREANAESLPFPDASFDAVVSAFGVIFAPDHAAAAGELARVCRPGGTVALTSWAGGGWMMRWLDKAAMLAPPPPPGGPRPDEWGDADEVVRRLAAAGLSPQVEVRAFDWDFADADEAVAFLTRASGPFIAFLAMAEAQGRGDEARALLREAIVESDVGTDGRCLLPAPYLLAVGRRPA